MARGESFFAVPWRRLHEVPSWYPVKMDGDLEQNVHYEILDSSSPFGRRSAVGIRSFRWFQHNLLATDVPLTRWLTRYRKALGTWSRCPCFTIRDLVRFAATFSIHTGGTFWAVYDPVADAGRIPSDVTPDYAKKSQHSIEFTPFTILFGLPGL